MRSSSNVLQIGTEKYEHRKWNAADPPPNGHVCFMQYVLIIFTTKGT